MFSKFFTFSLNAFIALVLTGTASICLAQGNTWDTTKTPMPTLRHVHRACTVDGKIYVMGGITSIGCDFPISKVEVYDPQTDDWDTTKTPMPTARESFGLSAVNGKIYAIGGQTNNCSNYLSSVEVYDPVTDTWSDTLAPMTIPRGALSTSVVNGKIYAIGGNNGTDLTTVEEYDPVTNNWTTKADMLIARAWFSTSVVDGKIYAFPKWYGGPSLAQIDVYDPVTDIWSPINIPVQLGGDCSASTVNGLIYTFGGIGFMSDVWEYNSVSDTWLPMSPMPTGRADAPATEVNGKVYVIGGSTTSWPSHPASMVEEYTPPSSVIVFSDDFESYTAGEQLACQNPTDWTTWSYAPCDTIEDPYVSNLYAFSGLNSVANVQDNSLVKLYGDRTSGRYSIAFMNYIPTGKNGIFSTYSVRIDTLHEAAMAVEFFPGGVGELNAGGAVAATFNYSHDTWQSVELIVDLDNDIGEFWFEGAMIYTWQWTLGIWGGGGALQLAASGPWSLSPGSHEMYIDDFVFTELLPVSVENEVDVKGPLTFGLDQNYPNPFNPSTIISWQVPVVSWQTLKIYDVLGNEVATLVNEEKPIGSYEVEFNAISLPSGIYFYRLQTGSFVETKKMVLLR
jgi:N-acetylneuraminic acid mutarotase